MGVTVRPSDRCRTAPGMCALVVVLAFACNALSAQKPPELDYLIRFTTTIAPVQEKYIHETLQGHESGAGVWVDGPYSQVKVRTHIGLDRSVLEEAWSGIGLSITSMELITNGSPQVRAVQFTEDPFPHFISTGDPQADNAAYEAAKAAWISAHPEAYEILSTPRDH